MSLINTSKEYFRKFSNKDLSGLKKMFSKDVSLRDWEINVRGINQVIEANKNIFLNLKDIEINILNLYNFEYTVIAEIEIDINFGESKLLVIDVIEFNKSSKICSIRAFKGN